ncbi:hypothetical protein [Actinomadura livida]|uniref:Uncharacterized protein n=1 Tax=Actinomadura livida TaxID=79909 RepID=A0A7W7IK16_9ACTN|nr:MULTISPECIES: hypothetical protein [Actinomadura]MBB4778512.1 hypothetical protein [Actinomadura catellatispora]GGU39791.1 hypothetical protein GCM10010208_75000 [Actinomadura livida]
MTDGMWLYQEHQMTPGTEIFRSDRRFFLEAYSASHSQLLLRSHWGDDELGQSHETTIDILFKPVDALKIETGLDGLVIRRANATEEAQIKTSLAKDRRSLDVRVFLLESRSTTGYIVSMAVGWREGILGPTRRSFFNNAGPWAPRWPTQSLGGVNPGFNEATTEDLINAIASPTTARRDRFRQVHVLMTRTDMPEGPEIFGAGVFLTSQDAEDARMQLAPSFTDCWIETLPVAL